MYKETSQKQLETQTRDFKYGADESHIWLIRECQVFGPIRAYNLNTQLNISVNHQTVGM